MMDMVHTLDAGQRRIDDCTLLRAAGRLAKRPTLGRHLRRTAAAC